MSQSHPPIVQVGQALLALLLLPVYVLGLLVYLLFAAYVRLVEWLFRFTKHGRSVFFPLDIYPWTTVLQDNWLKIRGELDGLLGRLDEVPNYQDVAATQRVLTQDDKWKAVVFNVMGQRVEENCRACPETARLIEGIPGLVYAMYSVLKPGKHIAPHQGPYGGALNCHLALRVPKERELCAIRVSNETRHWEEGRMHVFNDRYEHEAWNRSDELRVVLLMYVVRPLPFPLSAMNQFALFVSRFFRRSELTRIRQLANKAAKRGPRPLRDSATLTVDAAARVP
jgi:beta-hydroxylase